MMDIFYMILLLAISYNFFSNKNGNIKRSMEENKKRFNISDQLERILENTIDILSDH